MTKQLYRTLYQCLKCKSILKAPTQDKPTVECVCKSMRVELSKDGTTVTAEERFIAVAAE